MATSPDSVYNFIGAVDSFRQEGRNLFLDCGSAALALSVITPEIIRVRFAPQGSFSSRRSWAVTRPDEDWPETDFDFSEEPETLTLSTSKLKIQIRRSPCRLTILDSAGQILCEETEQGGLASSPDGKVACLKNSPPNEGYYGCGERTSLLNKRGRRYQNWTRDPYDTDFDHGPGTDNMYQAIPFFMALRPNAGGYGLYLNNTFHSVLDMDSMRNGYYSLEGRAGELDYYFIYGPDPASIVERYTAVTGRGLLPPRWALGFQQCRWSYFPDSVVMEVAKQYRERRLPADTIVLDIDYMNGFRVFTWGRQRFPDPKEMNDELARQGFKVITIVDPGVKYDPNGNYQVFNEAEQNDYLIKTAEGKLATGYVCPA
jgi:alpha-glucosidase